MDYRHFFTSHFKPIDLTSNIPHRISQCLTYRQNQFYKCSALYVKCTSMCPSSHQPWNESLYLYMTSYQRCTRKFHCWIFTEKLLDLSPFNQLRETLNYILILLCALILGCCKGNLHLTQPSKINVSWRNHGCLRRWHPPPLPIFRFVQYFPAECIFQIKRIIKCKSPMGLQTNDL